MTPPPRIQYRKLPGHRRGFLRGASVWAGPDHLLLVRSFRFREEYKRFYYRDVEAIAVADAPRFHISTRAAVLAFLIWIVAAVLAAGRREFALGALTISFLILALFWVFVSLRLSCRCRIYTAVSSDELASVYRRRTARKFLAKVHPLISAAQGVLEGPWAEAAEERGVGPPAAREAAEQYAKAEDAAPPRTIVSDLFIAALLIDAALLFFHPAASTAFRWISSATGLALLAAAVGVLAQRLRGGIRARMQKLALVAVVALGLSYYAQALGAGVMAGAAAARTGSQAIPLAPSAMDVPVVRKIRAGWEAALAIVGLVFSLSTPATNPSASWNKLVE